MTKLQAVRSRRHLSRNERGRDLVVGDLHGHRGLLERALDRLNFDPKFDRVLSVGDLVDRGPDSLSTLQLLEEPWFHAVLGNHELMLLHYLGRYSSRLYGRKAYLQGGGHWVLDAAQRHRRKLWRLADRLAELPLALQVEADMPFVLAHTGMEPAGGLQRRLERVDRVRGERVPPDIADVVTSARQHHRAVGRLSLTTLDFAGTPVDISASPMPGGYLTYVGHTPIRHVTVHDGFVHVEQGVGGPSLQRGEVRAPTVLDHGLFGRWLQGVASAAALATHEGAVSTLAMQIAA